MRRHPLRWILFLGFVAVCLIFQAVFGAPYKQTATTTTTPTCATSKEVYAYNLINRARVNHGLRKYGWWTCYQIKWARQHSRNMASKGYLYHTRPPLPSNWLAWGQNVGEGPSVYAVHHAFMQSSPHRANILDPDFKRVAPGIVTVNGLVWVTEDFIEP